MNAKIKGALFGIINVVGNLLLIDIIPIEYKVIVVLGFNLLQCVYMYFDPSYAFQQLGKKYGKVFTKEDLK